MSISAGAVRLGRCFSWLSLKVFADDLAPECCVADILFGGQSLEPLEVSYFQWDRNGACWTRKRYSPLPARVDTFTTHAASPRCPIMQHERRTAILVPIYPLKLGGVRISRSDTWQSAMSGMRPMQETSWALRLCRYVASALQPGKILPDCPWPALVHGPGVKLSQRRGLLLNGD
jgi:hypothetical protein